MSVPARALGALDRGARRLALARGRPVHVAAGTPEHEALTAALRAHERARAELRARVHEIAPGYDRVAPGTDGALVLSRGGGA